MEFLDGWTWNPEACPADQDFIEWADSEFGMSIFHMGTGLHHRVGVMLGERNTVLGLTYSPAEVQSYLTLIRTNPMIQIGYQVFLCQLFMLNANLLPKFDLVTLFHVGETDDSHYGIVKAVETFRHKMNPRGRILAYAGSTAAKRVIPIFNDLMNRYGEYKSLIIYEP